MRVESKKLYNGNAEVPEEKVKQCIRLGEKMEIMHKGDIMTLSPEQLVSERDSISQWFGTGDSRYRIYGYPWNPDTVEL